MKRSHTIDIDVLLSFTPDYTLYRRFCPESLSYPWSPLIMRGPVDPMDRFAFAAGLFVDISGNILLNNSADTQYPMKYLSEL